MATLSTGYAWQSGDIVTPELLNQTVNSATVSSIVNADISTSANITKTKIAGTAITLADTGVVTGSMVANDTLVNANISPTAAIVPSKLGAGALPTTVTVANANITGTITNDKIASDLDASKLTTGTLPIARIADSAVIPAKLAQKLTFDTAKASTSGTNIDFTGIPTWAKRVTLLFSGVSTSGTANKRIRLGVGGSFATTGYVTTRNFVTSAILTGSGTEGFDIETAGQAGELLSGQMVFTNITGNTWVGIGQFSSTSGNQPGVFFSGGNITLSGALDSIRVTTVNAANSFDAGNINISYEG